MMIGNTNRHLLLLRDAELADCEEYADRLVAHYKAGGSPSSLAVSGGRGTEFNVDRQLQGKIGEVAVALYFGLDPKRAVNWEMRADNGGDVSLDSAGILDVKTTATPFKLIWSRTVNHLYFTKQFDFLVAVSNDADERRICWIEGYMSKKDFFLRKRIANGINSNLELGTWFVDKAELSDIDELWERHLRKVAA